uniref:Uncharacterized protein n=1 Tax=Arcella intermedia TaxID=1963864 RepID=A0A6B2L2P6_9EUKA
MKKKIAKYTEFNKTTQKSLSEIEEELQGVLNELRTQRKVFDETKIESDAALKSKNDIDSQLKHVSALRMEQEKEIQSLLNKKAEIEIAIENFHESQRKWSLQKEGDLKEFEREKNAIQIQSRFLGRKLEDDRRILQSKFFEAKQELKRNYRREVDQLKQKQDLQLTDFERDSKTEISNLKDKYTQKIKTLETNNYNLRNKIESIQQTLSKQEETITDLEKSLQRETTNSEVMGVTSVEWLDPEQRENFMNEFLTSQEKTLDRLIQQIHDKLIAAGEDLLLSKRKKQAADRQVKELRRALNDQSTLVSALHTAKNDIDRRYSKRIDQLEGLIERKNKNTQSDYHLEKNKLLGNVEDKDEQLLSLKKELEELQQKIKAAKVTAAKFSDKVSEKLDVERQRFISLEKEKHDLSSEAQHYNRQIGDLKEKISALNLEVNRFKEQVALSKTEYEKLLDKNTTLEQSVRKLENTSIKG